MTSFLKSDRSRPVAIWLFAVAFLVLAMVVVGGATRLTGSGLSITEWRPVTGAIPPLDDPAWQAEFAKYRQIPQYELVNRGMSLAAFKSIYWWEWGHRFLGRLIGLAFAAPFLVFLIRRQIPSRLIWRCWVLLVLGGLQGAVGWWMVASGLSERVSVAPERLMTHQGLAFVVFAGLVWTGLDAWRGHERRTLPSPWERGAQLFAAAIFLQLMLGALVAGNDAGFVYNDWPLMNGALFPDDYAKDGIWTTIAHSQAAVQLHHRLLAYVLFFWALAMGFQARRSSYLAPPVKILALALVLSVVVQAALGVWTLMAATPIALGILHQAVAAVVFALAVGFAWRVRRL